MTEQQRQKNLDALPQQCATMHPTGEYPIILEKGVQGFRPAWSLFTKEDVIKFNTELGITPAQVEAMLCGSMFGWHVKGAHPDAYANLHKNRA